MDEGVPLEQSADSPWWPLDFVVAWISTRDQVSAARIAADLGVRGVDAVQRPTAELTVSLQQAMSQLWAKLQSGDVTAQGVLKGPIRYEEGPKIGIRRITIIRSVERLKIPASEWIDLRWNSGKSAVSAFGMKAYADVYLSRDEVVALWPSTGAIIVLTDPPATVSRGRGGTKMGSVIQALEELYPLRPASKNRQHLLEQLKNKLGFSVSPATLDRAWNEAWK